MSAFSKEEQELIDRLRASGRSVNRKQLDARFRFMIRPFTTAGVPSVELASWFEDAIFGAISGMVFESPITGVVIFPKIFDEKVADPPDDYWKYNENDKSVFVSLGVDFCTWNSALHAEKIRLLYENIRCSLERIPDTYLFRSDYRKLLRAIDEVYAALVRRVPT
jgi:hypothetical protein